MGLGKIDNDAIDDDYVADIDFDEALEENLRKMGHLPSTSQDLPLSALEEATRDTETDLGRKRLNTEG